MKNNVLPFLLLGLLFISVNFSFAQTKNELEKKKKNLQKEISYTNKLLKETRKNKDHSLEELLNLKSKINARSNLISAMGAEMRLINRQISKNTTDINTLEKELVRLKKEYAKNYLLCF